MNFEVEIYPDAIEEINESASYFGDKIAEGSLDFLLAIEDTVERISRLPNAFPIRSSALQIRGAQVKNTQSGLSRTRKFPFLLLYMVLESHQKVVIYQLWPTRSNLPIRPAPSID